MSALTARRRDAIRTLRRFNRYYTNRLGLLSRYRFDTALTLTEARVIYEIGLARRHTQSALGGDLKVDMGYLHRVVRRLEASGLISIRKDISDGRVSVLSLTGSGRAMLSKINRESDAEVEDLLRGMDPQEAEALVMHVEEAHRLLVKQAKGAPTVQRAESRADIEAARVLMKEYAAFLGEDLTFQRFEKELAGLPGKYAPPSGALFLVLSPSAAGKGAPAGCVALRKLSPGICEMKRLFVRPNYRGQGMGRLLAERVIQEGEALGYKAMRLDTLERLTSAVDLYVSLGFRQIPPYCDNPIPGVMFWEKKLSAQPRPLTSAGRSSRKRPAP